MAVLFAHNASSSIQTRACGTLVDVCITVETSPPWLTGTVEPVNQILLDRIKTLLLLTVSLTYIVMLIATAMLIDKTSSGATIKN